jgi:hypothetical protein
LTAKICRRRAARPGRRLRFGQHVKNAASNNLFLAVTELRRVYRDAGPLVRLKIASCRSYRNTGSSVPEKVFHILTDIRNFLFVP